MVMRNTKKECNKVVIGDKLQIQINSPNLGRQMLPVYHVQDYLTTGEPLYYKPLNCGNLCNKHTILYPSEVQ